MESVPHCRVTLTCRAMQAVRDLPHLFIWTPGDATAHKDATCVAIARSTRRHARLPMALSSAHLDGLTRCTCQPGLYEESVAPGVTVEWDRRGARELQLHWPLRLPAPDGWWVHAQGATVWLFPHTVAPH